MSYLVLHYDRWKFRSSVFEEEVPALIAAEFNLKLGEEYWNQKIQGYPTTQWWVALEEKTKKVVGCICLQTRWFYWYISDLVVAKEHRRNGIATSLLEHARVAVPDGAEVIGGILDSNTPSRALFAKLGATPYRRSTDQLQMYQWTKPTEKKKNTRSKKK